MSMHPMTLFRLAVIGPPISCDRLPRGELKQRIGELATQPQDIPGNHRCYLSEKTIESWYYAYKRDGVEALAPKRRVDHGQSKISSEVQIAILKAKRDNPKRSINVIRKLLINAGIEGATLLSRSSIHRLLQQQGISRMKGSESAVEEFRSFEAQHCGDIWYSDAMHGPKVTINGRLRKTYLISFMDDASRLIAHGAFCPGETALDVEGVLKQALLKRGRPRKIVIDNGAAYRAKSLQGICARLGIAVVYCRPYRPEGKGKIERWHRVVRAQFVSELTSKHQQDLKTLNAYLWAWIEKDYHLREHSMLAGLSPLQRWQQQLEHVRSLGPYAVTLDEVFYHREQRKVRRDGTVSLWGQFFEVPFELSTRTLLMVTDPHSKRVVAIESLDGKPLGKATPLDRVANNSRQRHQASNTETTAAPSIHDPEFNALDQAYENYHAPRANEEE